MTRTGPKTHGDDDSGLVKRTFWITRHQDTLLKSLPPYTKSDVVRLALNDFIERHHATVSKTEKKTPARARQDPDDGQEP